MDDIRDLVAAHAKWDVRAVSVFPHGVSPQVAIDAPRMYPLYAKCVELGLPLFMTVGIAGPRVPSMCQKVELLDQVMYDFPDLVRGDAARCRTVGRPGGQADAQVAEPALLDVRVRSRATTRREIVEYANTRGASRIMYGGYFPMGLSLERIMTELDDVPFHDDVFPAFLRDNARRVLGLDRT